MITTLFFGLTIDLDQKGHEASQIAGAFGGFGIAQPAPFQVPKPRSQIFERQWAAILHAAKLAALKPQIVVVGMDGNKKG